MSILSKYPRVSYWSSSKLSHWIRTKFGLNNPTAMTLEGWDNHEDECAKKSPIIHWLTDRGFNKAQDICYLPVDIYWTVKTAPIWKFIRSVWLFRKALWNYRSWDYTGLLYLMETATKDMSECHKNHGHLVRSEQTAKELRVLSNLIKRVREDNYTEDKVELVNTGKKSWMSGWEFVQKKNTLPNYNAKSFYKLTQKQRQNDLKLVCKMMERKLFSWWD